MHAHNHKLKKEDLSKVLSFSINQIRLIQISILTHLIMVIL